MSTTNYGPKMTHRWTKTTRGTFCTLAALSAASCTGQVSGSFRFQQQLESFHSEQDVNTKVDLLWVVDNSSSMDVSQQKLRAGFQSFATKYLKPTWDIRVAVISTDTYLANPAFQGYLGTTVTGSVGYQSPYIQSRLSSFQNPSWNTSLVNLTTGKMDSGIKYKEMIPAWGTSFARLLSGNHDGPITSFCFEGMPYFFLGAANCKVRDDGTQGTGITACVNPTGSQSSIEQCVNTVQNDTVHSGKAILATQPPAGTPGDSTWTQQLVRDFMVNASTGSSGHGSERGLSSVLQLLNDNESTSTAFFRAGSVRVLIFVSDEEDQSMQPPASPPSGFQPFSDYACDQAGLIALNGQSTITGPGGYCCASGCQFGSSGTSCPSKTVDGLTYTVSICPNSAKLIPVSTVKSTLDTFFRNLDQSGSTGDPGYFVASIVPTTAQAIQDLQADRTTSDFAVGTLRTVAVDRGDRYIQLGTLASPDSLALDISAQDYSPILDSIGQKIIQKRATFLLNFAPTGTDDMIVSIRHITGADTVVPSAAIAISGKILRITDLDLVLNFSSTDQIVINYQPKSNL